MLVHFFADQAVSVRIERHQSTVDVLLKLLIGKSPATNADLRALLDALFQLAINNLLQDLITINSSICILVQHTAMFDGTLLATAGEAIECLHQIINAVVLWEMLQA